MPSGDERPPYFLDFEASGLGTLGFPIQVAWGSAESGLECWLIRPDPAWRIEEGWEPAAERIHGIPRESLYADGKEAAWVAARMNAQLAGQTAYADGLPYDRLWLEQLFASGGQAPQFRLENFDDLLYEVAAPHLLHRTGWMEELRAHAVKRLKGLRWHQADNDVRRLIEMHRLATARK